MYQWISVTKLQAVAAGVREFQKWKPWSRRNSELPRKPTDAHKLLVTFTDASRNLHVTAGQIVFDLLGAGVSSSGLHMQKDEASANNSNPPTSLSVERVGALLIIKFISNHPISNHPIPFQSSNHPII